MLRAPATPPAPIAACSTAKRIAPAPPRDSTPPTHMVVPSTLKIQSPANMPPSCPRPLAWGVPEGRSGCQRSCAPAPRGSVLVLDDREAGQRDAQAQRGVEPARLVGGDPIVAARLRLHEQDLATPPRQDVPGAGVAGVLADLVEDRQRPGRGFDHLPDVAPECRPAPVLAPRCSPAVALEEAKHHELGVERGA